MKIGINFTLGETLNDVQHLIQDGLVDYCELLIDNFLHVPPDDIARAFDVPLGFHIMLSRFLETDLASLKQLAHRLKPYIDTLQPTYISDHVARFSHQGRQLYHLAEVDYRQAYDAIKARVETWQELTGSQLLLENFPSILDGGRDAPEFFTRLQADTGAGVLFDFSNAICARHNCELPLAAWDAVIRGNRHFHVGSYSPSILAPPITLDTHDAELSPDTLEFLCRHREHLQDAGVTLTYERDDNPGYDVLARELTRLRQHLTSQLD